MRSGLGTYFSLAASFTHSAAKDKQHFGKERLHTCMQLVIDSRVHLTLLSVKANLGSTPTTIDTNVEASLEHERFLFTSVERSKEVPCVPLEDCKFIDFEEMRSGLGKYYINAWGKG